MVTKNIILLQALASTPLEIMRLLKGLDEVTAFECTAADEGAIADLLNDMINIEKRYQLNFQRTFEEQPVGSLTDSHQGANGAPLSLQGSIDRLKSTRDQTLTFLSTLSPSDWARATQHQSGGETPFQFLVQHLIEQDRVHLNQLATWRA